MRMQDFASGGCTSQTGLVNVAKQGHPFSAGVKGSGSFLRGTGDAKTLLLCPHTPMSHIEKGLLANILTSSQCLYNFYLCFC